MPTLPARLFLTCMAPFREAAGVRLFLPIPYVYSQHNSGSRYQQDKEWPPTGSIPGLVVVRSHSSESAYQLLSVI